MIIHDYMDPHNTHPFSMLQDGCVFLFGHDYYMKLNVYGGLANGGDKINAVNLCSNYPALMGADDEVTLVDGELYITPMKEDGD